MIGPAFTHAHAAARKHRTCRGLGSAWARFMRWIRRGRRVVSYDSPTCLVNAPGKDYPLWRIDRSARLHGLSAARVPRLHYVSAPNCRAGPECDDLEYFIAGFSERLRNLFRGTIPREQAPWALAASSSGFTPRQLNR